MDKPSLANPICGARRFRSFRRSHPIVKSTSAREQGRTRYDLPFESAIVPHEGPPASLAARSVRGFGRWLKGAVPVLAVLYLLPLAAIVWTSASLSTGIQRIYSVGNTMEKQAIADAAVPFGVKADAAVTPEMAGRAFLAMQPPPTKPGRFAYRTDVAHDEAPWRTWKLAPGLFRDAQSGTSWQGPRSDKVLDLVAKGFTPAERDFLRQVATAPIWRDYDLFARAPAADMIGGRFALPFPAEATWMEFPITRFAATKELAYASVMRAAWHLAEGRRDSAEAVLRSTISFGHVLAANAPFVIDQLIGSVITGIGRSALQQLLEITHDPRAAAVASAGDKSNAAAAAPIIDKLKRVGAVPAGRVEEVREALVAIVADPTIPRPLRFEALTSLSLTTCMRSGDILLGPGRTVRDGFATARSSLARSEGERQLVDLIERTLDQRLPPGATANAAGDIVSQGAGFLGTVYFNRRVANCALVAASMGNVLR